jgi:hypothetical protein
MKRRFNYTGRIRVPQKTITITLDRDSHGTIESFKAIINLVEFQLPATAKVFVEAYYRTEQHRYDFGTVGKIKSPENTSLSDLAYTENLKFRVLVVGDNGKILAAADRIRPVGEVQKSILPVELDSSLEKQIWRIAYEGDENAPILHINKNIPGMNENVLHSSEFIFHVYPSVLREVLTHIIFIDILTDQEEPDAEWQEKWLKFATMIFGDQPPNLCKNSDNFDTDQAEEWIENVVKEFCASRNNWEEFVARFEGIPND